MRAVWDSSDKKYRQVPTEKITINCIVHCYLRPETTLYITLLYYLLLTINTLNIINNNNKVVYFQDSDSINVDIKNFYNVSGPRFGIGLVQLPPSFYLITLNIILKL